MTGNKNTIHQVHKWNITKPHRGSGHPQERFVGMCRCGKQFGPATEKQLDTHALTHLLQFEQVAS